MFGPEHPRRDGRGGLSPAPDGLDANQPGFGPFGTSGQHCFDPLFPAFTRIAALNHVRRAVPAVRYGRQYQRPTSIFEQPFVLRGAGELLAWSRILDDQEALCVVNTHGVEARGANTIVDASLNPGTASGFVVVANTAQAAGAPASHPIGSTVPVRRSADGTAFVEIRDVGPSEALVLVNQR
jgi:hypothetical protein